MNFNSWIFKFWPLTKYDAITLPWGVYFRLPVEQVDIHTIKHEQVHIDQKKQIGILKFYTLYLYFYLRNLIKYRDHWKAYYNIPFEVEAYEKQ